MSWTDTKPIRWILGVIVVLVWGILLYRIATRMAGPSEVSNPMAQVQAPSVHSNANRPTVRYQGDFRDPFQQASDADRRPNRQLDPRPEHPMTAPAQKPKPAPPEPSPAEGPLLRGYKLVGVVDRTAIVRPPGQKVQFLKRGAYVDGAEVTDVSPNRLVVQKDDRTDTLRISTSRGSRSTY
jgi:hypothetical protein